MVLLLFGFFQGLPSTAGPSPSFLPTLLTHLRERRLSLTLISSALPLVLIYLLLVDGLHYLACLFIPRPIKAKEAHEFVLQVSLFPYIVFLFVSASLLLRQKASLI